MRTDVCKSDMRGLLRPRIHHRGSTPFAERMGASWLHSDRRTPSVAHPISRAVRAIRMALRSRSEVVLENIALRQQVGVLTKKRPRPPLDASIRCRPADTFRVVVETKGQEDLDSPRKMHRLRQWCEDINRIQTDVTYDFVFVDEKSFDRYKPRSFKALLERIHGIQGRRLTDRTVPPVSTHFPTKNPAGWVCRSVLLFLFAIARFAACSIAHVPPTHAACPVATDRVTAAAASVTATLPRFWLMPSHSVSASRM